MSRYADGSYRCDRDGTDVGNGSVENAVIVTDLSEDGHTVRILHFCRVNGCAAKVLSSRNLAHYEMNKEATS